MSPKANIYVSVTRARSNAGEQSYHRPLHTWLLSVEPHASTFHVPGTAHKEPEPIHYAAAKNEETGVYTINTHPHASEPAIIGNILIAENAQTVAEDIHRLLAEELGPVAGAPEDHKAAGEEAEHWIELAIRAMQKRKIIEHFDTDEFMTFAHGYEANRMDGEGHALIAYPKIHRDHEKKASKHKFWVSHPMDHRTKQNDRGEASVYGGLM